MPARSQVNTLNGPLTASRRRVTSAGRQPISRAAPTPVPTPSCHVSGPADDHARSGGGAESIKHLGTNGGGWFNANSAHPFENPNPMTNVLETILMALLPMAMIYTLGIMINRLKQAWTFFWVMAGFFLVFLVIAYVGEVGRQSSADRASA